MDDERYGPAKAAEAALIDAMNAKNMHYEKTGEFTYAFAVEGDDLAMFFRVKIDPELKIAYLHCPQQFVVPPDKRRDVAIAVNGINCKLIDGSFDFDADDGTLSFRMTTTFVESLISPDVFCYMIECAAATVDEYNDKLFGICAGFIDALEYIKTL